MGVRVVHHDRHKPNQTPIAEVTDTEYRETTVDGQTYAWMPGQVRNFADDGVGLAHAAFDGDENKTQEDAVPFGDSRS